MISMSNLCKKIFVGLMVVIGMIYFWIQGENYFENEVLPTEIPVDNFDSSGYGEVVCHYEQVSGGMADTTRDSQFSPPPDRAIFFHETSCRSKPGVIHITAREACAVESAAKVNQDHQIYLLFSKSIWSNLTTTNPGQRKILDEILSYSNVHIGRVDLRKYVVGTPLEEWFATGALKSSKYRTSHTSDVLRFLTLWKYGGIYLDLDVVVMQPLGKLGGNFAGRESSSAIAAGVLATSRFGTGHAFAEALLRDLRLNFSGRKWGYNGPGVVTRVLARQCRTAIPALMNTERCQGFTVYPPKEFYPIYYSDWSWYFNPRKLKQATTALKNASIAHVWNKFSSKAKTKPTVEVAYTKLAKLYCPKVYGVAKDDF